MGVESADITIVPRFEGYAGDTHLVLRVSEDEAEFPAVFFEPRVCRLVREGYVRSREIVQVGTET